MSDKRDWRGPRDTPRKPVAAMGKDPGESSGGEPARPHPANPGHGDNHGAGPSHPTGGQADAHHDDPQPHHDLGHNRDEHLHGNSGRGYGGLSNEGFEDRGTGRVFDRGEDYGRSDIETPGRAGQDSRDPGRQDANRQSPSRKAAGQRDPSRQNPDGSSAGSGDDTGFVRDGENARPRDQSRDPLNR